jgi:hypothetical protein
LCTETSEETIISVLMKKFYNYISSESTIYKIIVIYNTKWRIIMEQLLSLPSHKYFIMAHFYSIKSKVTRLRNIQKGKKSRKIFKHTKPILLSIVPILPDSITWMFVSPTNKKILSIAFEQVAQNILSYIDSTITAIYQYQIYKRDDLIIRKYVAVANNTNNLDDYILVDDYFQSFQTISPPAIDD